MTRHRARAVLLLFLLLNLTACETWRSVTPTPPTPMSVARLIEEDRPDRVRVTGRGVLEVEVLSPSVEGDQLVGLGDFSMPLGDIFGLEVRGLSLVRTVLLALPVMAVVGGVICTAQGYTIGPDGTC